MAEEERCIHDLLIGQCGACKPSSGPEWEAKFPASCQTCGERIEVGDKVKWTKDGLYPQHARH